MGCTNDNAAAVPIVSTKMPKAGFGEGDVEGTQVVAVGCFQRLKDWTAGPWCRPLQHPYIQLSMADMHGLEGAETERMLGKDIGATTEF